VSAIDGLSHGLVNAGDALQYSYAPPVTDAHTFVIPVTTSTVGTPRFASKVVTFESVNRGSCIQSRDPATGTSHGLAGPAVAVSEYTTTFTVVEQQGVLCDPSTVREGVEVTLTMHSGGENTTTVARWYIETRGSTSLSTLESSCTVEYVNTDVLGAASCVVVGGGAGDSASQMEVSQVSAGGTSTKSWSLPVVAR
jgi:hypothetical protein